MNCYKKVTLIAISGLFCLSSVAYAEEPVSLDSVLTENENLHVLQQTLEEKLEKQAKEAEEKMKLIVELKAKIAALEAKAETVSE